jgi:hypothetical protein
MFQTLKEVRNRPTNGSRVQRAATTRTFGNLTPRGSVQTLLIRKVTSKIISLCLVSFAKVGHRRDVKCTSLANRRLTALLALLFVLLLATTAAAQVSKVSATLEGTLADGSGAPIPGAEIKLRNTETNSSGAFPRLATRRIATDRIISYCAS